MSGTWSEDSITGKPCDVYRPAKLNEHGYAVIYLHGVHLQKLHDKTPFLEQLERFGLPLVAPYGARSWWTDRICEEFDPNLTAERYILEHAVRFTQEKLGAAPGKIALLGTSMGGQGALRLAYKHPHVFPVAAAISPAIDFHLRYDEGDETIPLMYDDPEHARQDTALLHIHPLNWPRHQFFCCDPSDRRWWNSADRLRMKLYSLGVPHTCDLESSGGGHGFEYYNRMAPQALGFIADRLDQERRRIT